MAVGLNKLLLFSLLLMLSQHCYAQGRVFLYCQDVALGASFTDICSRYTQALSQMASANLISFTPSVDIQKGGTVPITKVFTGGVASEPTRIYDAIIDTAVTTKDQTGCPTQQWDGTTYSSFKSHIIHNGGIFLSTFPEEPLYSACNDDKFTLLNGFNFNSGSSPLTSTSVNTGSGYTTSTVAALTSEHSCVLTSPNTIADNTIYPISGSGFDSLPGYYNNFGGQITPDSVLLTSGTNTVAGIWGNSVNNAGAGRVIAFSPTDLAPNSSPSHRLLFENMVIYLIDGCKKATTCNNPVTNCSDIYLYTEGCQIDSVNYIMPTVECEDGTIYESIYNSGLEIGSVAVVGSYPTSVKFQGGPVETCTFTIYVLNNEPPVASSSAFPCPEDIVVYSPNACSTVVNYVKPQYKNNCSPIDIILFTGNLPGEQFNVGSTLVSYIAVDEFGVNAYCDFTVTVFSDLPGTTIPGCPNGDLTFTIDTCTDSGKVNLPVATPCDPNDPIPTATVLSPATTNVNTYDFPIGIHEINVEYNDNGVLSYCTFTLTLNHSTLPVMTCPSSFSVNVLGNTCFSKVDYILPIISHECDEFVPPPYYLVQGLAPLENFPIGTTTVRYESPIYDLFCEFDVTVTNDIASSPIVVENCQESLIHYIDDCTYPTTSSIPLLQPTATNCDGSPVNFILVEPNNLISFNEGETYVLYEAENNPGVICEFTVTVASNAPPSFEVSCPEDISVSSGAACAIKVDYEEPTMSTNCLGNSEINLISGNASGSFFGVGITEVVYEVSDGFYSTQCSFNIIVSSTATTSASINCPTDIFIQAPEGDCTTVVDYINPSAFGCDGSTSLPTALFDGLHSGEEFPVGVTTVTWMSADHISGTDFVNVYCSFDVTVTPTLIAIETIVTGFCPTTFSPLSIATTDCSAVVTYDLPEFYTDSCGVDNTLTYVNFELTEGYLPGEYFPLGTTTTVSFVASNGLDTAVCSLDISVGSTQTLTTTLTCPEPRFLLAPDCNGVEVFYEPVQGIDCNGSTITGTLSSGFASGITFPIGDTEVVYTYTDNNGFDTTCSFLVSVTTQTSEPTISTCPGTLTHTANTKCGDFVSYPTPTVEVCGNTVPMTRVSGPLSGDFFAFSTHTILYVYDNGSADDGSEMVECQFDIIVQPSSFDGGAMTMSGCPIDMTFSTADCTHVVTFATPTTTGCGFNSPTSVEQFYGLPSGSEFPLGVNYVSFVATTHLLFIQPQVYCHFTVTITNSAVPPLQIHCPDNILVNSCNPTPVDYIRPTGDDHCGQGYQTSYVIGGLPGSTFDLGETTVTYELTEDTTVQCSFTVTVTCNTGNCAITCPEDIVTFSDTCSDVIVNYTQATTTDCTSPVVESGGPGNGNPFPFGETVITFTADTASCDLTIVVTSEEEPYFVDCPSETLIFQNTSGDCGMVVDFDTPTAIGGCASFVTVTQIAGGISGSIFANGNTGVVFQATDGFHVTYCSFDIIVNPQNGSGMSITCPIDDVVTAVDCEHTISYKFPSATNCAGSLIPATWFSGPQNNDIVEPGIYYVTLQAQDGIYNSYCYFTIEVIGDELLTVECPGIVGVQTTECSVPVIYDTPYAIDDCLGPVPMYLQQGLPSGSNFLSGATTVIYETGPGVSDATCEFVVKVDSSYINPQTPTLVCNDVIAETTNCKELADLVTVNDVTLTDCEGNSTIQDFEITHNPGPYPIGETLVEVSVTDTTGYVQTCQLTVTVHDGEAPIIAGCPVEDIVADAKDDCGVVVTFKEPTVSDNCVNNIAFELISGQGSGEIFTVGTTTVIYEAFDGFFTSTCEFTVTVTSTSNGITLNCPSDHIFSGQSCENKIPLYEVTGTDCAGKAITPVLQGAIGAPGDIITVGTTTVTYYYTDNINGTPPGVTGFCSFDVIYSLLGVPAQDADNCPKQPITEDIKDGCSYTGGYDPIYGSHPCIGYVAYELESGPSPNDNLPIGTTTITYVAEEGLNLNDCTFDIIITSTSSPSTIQCSPSFVVTIDDCNPVNVDYTLPTVTSCNGVNPATAVFESGIASGALFPIGTTENIYSYTEDGITIECSFFVTVEHSTPTVFTDCPTEAITNTAANGECGAKAEYKPPTLTDPCNGSPQVYLLSGPAPGEYVSIGTHTIIYSSTPDFSGVLCTFDIIVSGTQTGITFTGCPNDPIVIDAPPGECDAVGVFKPVTATGCGGKEISVTLTNGLPSGSTFPEGDTIVTFQAIDNTNVPGTTAYCTFTVIVNGDKEAFIECPDDQFIAVGSACAANNVIFDDAIASSICGDIYDVELTSDIESGGTFPVGTNTVTFAVTSSITTTCFFEITVTNDGTPAADTQITCPSDVIVLFDSDKDCKIPVTYDDAVAVDCAGNSSDTEAADPTQASGQEFPVGDTIVTLQVVDDTSINCQFTVSVYPSSPPQLSGCPVNDIIVNANDECGALVSYDAPTFESICSGDITMTMISGYATGGLYTTGSNDVIYHFTDGFNEVYCEFQVIVLSSNPGVQITCPPNQFIDTSDCESEISYEFGNAVGCDGNVITTSHYSGYENGDIAPPGVHEIVLIAVDDQNPAYSDFCMFTITINNIIDISDYVCNIDDVTVIAVNNVCGTIATYDTPIATDDCLGYVPFVLQEGLPSGSVFPIGTTTVVYEATDDFSTITCSFDVIIEGGLGSEEVYIDCPAPIYLTSTNCDTATFDIVTPIAYDCQGNEDTEATDSIIQTPNIDTWSIGITSVTFETESNGLPVSCTTEVHVSDGVLPEFEIQCPEDIVVTADPVTDCGTSVEFIRPTASDDCFPNGLGVYLIQGLESGSIFNTGDTVVEFGVFDGFNTVTCQFTVTVHSQSQGITFFNCPTAPMRKEITDGCEVEFNYLPPTAMDCNGNDIPVILQDGLAPGELFSVGITTISYIVEDPNSIPSGVSSFCQFDVIIDNTAIDNLEVHFCPTPNAVTIPNNECALVTTYEQPLAFRECMGFVPFELVSGLPSGSTFPVGTTPIQYIATDGTDSVVCEFNVIVGSPDLTPSTIQCPDPVLIFTDNCNGVTVDFEPAVVLDCNGATVDPTLVDSTPTSGDLFTIGQHVVEFSYNDNGYIISCEMDITVVPEGDSVFTSCPTDFSVTVANNGDCGAVVVFDEPEAEDACGNQLALTYVSGLPSGGILTAGTTDVVITAFDGYNTITCSFEVTVESSHPGLILNCPNDQEDTTTGCSSNTFTWNDFTGRGCDGSEIDAVLYSGPGSGEEFETGVTTVTYWITDHSYDFPVSAFCSFTITLENSVDPEITCPTADITGVTDDGECSTAVNFEVTAIDDCLGAIATSGDYESGDLFEAGTTVVTYTATDGFNEVECSFNVVITDNQDPTFSTCPGTISSGGGGGGGLFDRSNDDGSITVGTDPGVCTYDIEQLVSQFEYTDNCNNLSYSFDVTGGDNDFVAPGTYDVDFTITDADGGSITCSFVLHVEDQEDPVVVCPDNFNWPSNTDLIYDITSSDNCAETYQITPATSAPGEQLTPGVYDVSVTSTDTSGNTATCSFTITVTTAFSTPATTEGYMYLYLPIVVDIDPTFYSLSIPPGDNEVWVEVRSTDSAVLTPLYRSDKVTLQHNLTFLGPHKIASDVYKLWFVTFPSATAFETNEFTLCVTPYVDGFGGSGCKVYYNILN